MINIANYHRAQSLEEAYELNLKRNNVVLGGMLWLKLQKKHVATAIDLCELHLDNISDVEGEYHIGAMVSLREIEKSEILNKITNNAFSECLKHLVGVQFRNLATIGGSVFSKFGFSDITTLLLALDAKLEFYNVGIISLQEYLKNNYKRDILIKIIIEKKEYNTVFISQRNSKTDFSVLNCAISETDSNYRIAVGARPKKANVILLEKQEDIANLAECVSKRFDYGDNNLASGEYRKHICTVLVARAIKQLNERK